MKTLEQAVAVLNALTAEEAQAVLTNFPNTPIPERGRCTTCPIALYLEHETGGQVWVSPAGYATPARDDFPVSSRADGRNEFELANHVIDLMRVFDLRQDDYLCTS
jgi:hypothetical protein